MPADRDRGDERDDYDDHPGERLRGPSAGGAEGFATIVPYRNGAALAAYYTGVFGLIPVLGFLLGPIAFILGLVGLRNARNVPRAHGTGHAIAGIVLGLIDPFVWPIAWYLFMR